jgi:putative Holliday junction resolvase
MIFDDAQKFIAQVQARSPAYKLIGLDVGERKIGVAMVNSLVSVVLPLKVIIRSTLARDTEIIRKLLKEEGGDALVIGLPLTMDGQENEQSKKIRYLAKHLAENLSLPLIFQDERFTSKLANVMLGQGGLKRKERARLDDQVSAQLILESFLLKLRH